MKFSMDWMGRPFAVQSASGNDGDGGDTMIVALGFLDVRKMQLMWCGMCVHDATADREGGLVELRALEREVVCYAMYTWLDPNTTLPAARINQTTLSSNRTRAAASDQRHASRESFYTQRPTIYERR